MCGISFVLIQQVLELHDDRVRSMCITDSAHVLTGPGSKDGRIAVWKSYFVDEDTVDASELEHFEVL